MDRTTSTLATLVLGLSIPAASILFAADGGSSDEGASLGKSKTSIFTKESLEKTIDKAKKLEKKPTQHKFMVSELETKIVNEIKGKVISLVLASAEVENAVFQTVLKNLRLEVKQLYIEGLKSFGQADLSEDENDINFIRVWKNAINSIYLEELSRSGEDQEKKRKTTIINLLLRQNSCRQLDQKLQTLIENGADRNLHKEFMTSPRMNNQSEYPLRIALVEIKDQALRYELLRVLLDDNVHFQWQNAFVKEDPLVSSPLEPAIASLQTEGNARFVLNMLLDQSDFKTFNIVMSYVESHNMFITEPFTDKSSQIEDQIKSDVLENVLNKMRAVRQKSLSTDKTNKRFDNIAEFYSSEIVEADMAASNDDNRFDETFRERLRTDFQAQFDAIAEQIDTTHRKSEIQGSEFQALAIEWAKWANFRNRIASHLNKYALSATNKAEKSNVIKLIRYANTYKNGDVRSEVDEVYMELYALGGRNIIFSKVNRLGWTPLMYAMFQKQSDGFQLLVHQVQPDITIADGVDNNILHLAFPLPEEFFKAENSEHTNNAHDYVGVDSSDKDMRKKTSDAIKAILTERTISQEQKIAALTKISAANYTPVSLAAALGFYEVYEYLVDFLKGAGAWNRDDHEHLADPVERIYNQGLKKFLEVNRDNLSEAEISAITQRINTSNEEIVRVQSLSERFSIYHQETYSSVENLRLIMTPAKELLKDFDVSKRNTKAPFEAALSAAIKAMLGPEQIRVESTVTVYDTVYQEVEVPNPKPLTFLQGLTHHVRKKIKKKIEVKVPRQVNKVEYVKSPLDGIRVASSIVKSSYLAEVVRMVLDSYLFYANRNTQISFDDAYRAITESDNKTFFRKSFNETVEKRMQKLIRDHLTQAGRLKIEDKTLRKANRFDGLGGKQNKDDLADFVDNDDAKSSDSDAENVL